MTNERDAAIWTRVLENVVGCVPQDVRAEVLRRLAETEPEAPLRAVRLSEMGESLRHYGAEREAASVLVQVLVRSITNSHSAEDAAKVLFREHRLGSGSRWLPDYLDQLPGIVVKLDECRKIASTNGPSKLESRGE